MKAFVGSRDHLTVGSFHRTFHRTSEIGNGAGPVALGDFHFVRMVNEVIVWKRLEELDRFRFMIRTAQSRFRLTGPRDDGVGRMALFKRIPVLPIPRVVERSHQFKVTLCHIVTPIVLQVTQILECRALPDPYRVCGEPGESISRIVLRAPGGPDLLPTSEQNTETREVLFHGLLTGDADRARTDDLLRDRHVQSRFTFLRGRLQTSAISCYE